MPTRLRLKLIYSDTVDDREVIRNYVALLPGIRQGGDEILEFRM